jgi:hypothetical protein
MTAINAIQIQGEVLIFTDGAEYDRRPIFYGELN